MASPQLNILIISPDNTYKERVRSLVHSNREGFEVKIDMQQEIDDRVKVADLILIDMSGRDFTPLFSLKKKTAVAVLCVSEPGLTRISSSSLESFSEIFIKPVSDLFFETRMMHLFSQVKENQQSYLERTWLDTMINNIPELIWFKDVKGEHLKVNDSFCRMVGKERSDIEGRGHYYIWDITPEDYSQGEYVCLESEEEVMKAGKTRIFDEVVKVKERMLRFKTYKSPVFGEDGKIIGTLGVAHNVTEFANQIMVADNLINGLPFPVLMLDRDNNIIKTNDSYNKRFASLFKNGTMLGLPLEDWLDDYWEILDYSDNLAKMTASIRLDGENQQYTLLQTTISDAFDERQGSFLICLDAQ